MALNTAQRMEALINRVVRVLQEQQSGVEYEISIEELVGMLAQKANVLAGSTGVHFETKVLFNRMLSNRDADLILLILENLAQNGIEATPPGKRVAVGVTGDAETIIFEVRDQGSGLPPGREARLFMPYATGKKGGSGIGLAISKQLTQSLGAKLELTDNSSAGCTFRLIVPQPSAAAHRHATDEPSLAVNKSD
jgi:signal transduction histidine kinase